jgi:hypothetical protein
MQVVDPKVASILMRFHPLSAYEHCPAPQNEKAAGFDPGGVVEEISGRSLYSAKIRSERQEGTQTLVEYEVADVHPAVLFLSHWPGGRESFPSKTVGHVPRAQGKATPDNGLNSSRDGCASKVLRLARCACNL